MKNTITALAALVALSCPAADAFNAPAVSLSAAQRATSHDVTRHRNHAGALQMRSDGSVNRRVVLALAAIPLLGLRKASAATLTEAEEIAKLQAEAARIQEIFDVQKTVNSNMPSLKDGLKAAKAPPAAAHRIVFDRSLSTPRSIDSQVAAVSEVKSTEKVDMKNVVAVIDKMMGSLKQDGEGGMRTVLAFSAPNNPVKNMPFQNVISAMRDNEYALLFGKFTSYVIKTPEKMAMNEEEGLEYSTVDVVVKAPYKTMLQNGVQFKDMVMGNDVDKLCSVTFRWNMRQERDGKWESDGCYVVPGVQA